MPFSDHNSDLVVLNTWAAGDVALTERRGTLASGARRKARYSIDVKSEPLLFDLDGMNLGNAVAEAWLGRIKDNVRGISAVASKTTQALRVRGAMALAKGQSWAMKRYGGGRMGTMQPNQTNKLFNDSERLVNGLHMRANPSDASYTINVPANRFNPGLFGAGYDAMIQKFFTLVPMLDPKKALGDPDIEKAVKIGLGDMMTKAESNAAASIARKAAQLRAAKLKLLVQIAKLAAEAAGF